MRALVTGSAGHLGEALLRALRDDGVDAAGIDVKPSPYTQRIASITDRDAVADAARGVDVVYHAATLHKPHVVTHGKRDFIDVNIGGTLTLLEAAVAAGVRAFVFTSTTSVYGGAFTAAGGDAALWVTEDTPPRPKNIYGVTKLAAENLCRLFHREHGLNAVVLRTSRFFPEDDDSRAARVAYDGDNLKVNELMYRRADIADMVDAHLRAAASAASLGFGLYIVSAPPPFTPDDAVALRAGPAALIERRVPGASAVYAERGWKLPATIDRVYDSAAAVAALGWTPRYRFADALERLARGNDYRSPLALAVGAKGYHGRRFDGDGPYPVAD